METIAKSGIPLGLWGLPEPAAEGPVRLNSLCGLTMFCSIIRTHLKGLPIRYKWFYGERQDRRFAARFEATVRSLKTVDRLKGARIGIIGGVAPGFLNVYADRREIERRFGVQVAEYEFSDLRRLIEATPVDAAIRQLAGKMAAEVDGVSDDVKGTLELNAVVHESLKKFAADNALDSLAVSCWPRFRTELGIMPCAAYARLTDNGLVTACEGDLEGALSMRILQSLAGTSAMIMDFTDVDRAAEMIQYWHCGNAPLGCGQPGTVRLAPHFKPGSRVTCGDSMKVGTTYDMRFAPGEYTVFRLMDDGSRCLLFHRGDDGEPAGERVRRDTGLAGQAAVRRAGDAAPGPARDGHVGGDPPPPLPGAGRRRERAHRVHGLVRRRGHPSDTVPGFREIRAGQKIFLMLLQPVTGDLFDGLPAIVLDEHLERQVAAVAGPQHHVPEQREIRLAVTREPAVLVRERFPVDGKKEVVHVDDADRPLRENREIGEAAAALVDVNRVDEHLRSPHTAVREDHHGRADRADVPAVTPQLQVRLHPDLAADRPQPGESLPGGLDRDVLRVTIRRRGHGPAPHRREHAHFLFRLLDSRGPHGGVGILPLEEGDAVEDFDPEVAGELPEVREASAGIPVGTDVAEPQLRALEARGGAHLHLGRCIERKGPEGGGVQGRAERERAHARTSTSKIFPGLRIPFGSSARLTARIAATAPSPMFFAR